MQYIVLNNAKKTYTKSKSTFNSPQLNANALLMMIQRVR